MRDYFMKTERLGFSMWSATELELAAQLWGEEEFTRYIRRRQRLLSITASQSLKRINYMRDIILAMRHRKSS